MEGLPGEPSPRPMSAVPAEERNDDEGNRALTVVKVLSSVLLLGTACCVAFVAATRFQFFDRWTR